MFCCKPDPAGRRSFSSPHPVVFLIVKLLHLEDPVGCFSSIDASKLHPQNSILSLFSLFAQAFRCVVGVVLLSNSFFRQSSVVPEPLSFSSSISSWPANSSRSLILTHSSSSTSSSPIHSSISFLISSVM